VRKVIGSGDRQGSPGGGVPWAGVAGILLGALLLRVGCVLATPSYLLDGDSLDYVAHAVSIVDAHDYPSSGDFPTGPSAARPPLYPIFVAAIYAVVDNQHLVVATRLAQAVLGTAVVALIGFICWQLWGRRVAMVALGLAAIFPPLILVGTAVLSETLFVALALAACVCGLQRQHRLRWAALAGCLCGLAALTRSAGPALVVPLALAFVGPRGRGWQNALLPVGTLIAAATLTVAPWTVRNAIVLDSFVPISTQGGHTLAGSFNETVDRERVDFAWPWKLPEFADIYWRPRYQSRALAAQVLPGGTPRAWRTTVPEPEVDRRLRSATVDYITDHPVRTLKRAATKFAAVFMLRGPDRALISLEEEAMGRRTSRLLGTYALYPLMLFAFVGAWTARARRAPIWLWLVPILLLPATFIESLSRLRAPIDPFLIMLAALGIAAAVARAKRSRTIRPTRFLRGSARTGPL